MTIARDQTATGVTALESGTQVVTWATAPAAGATVLLYIATSATASAPTLVRDNGTTPVTFVQDVTNTVGGAAYSGIWRANGITLPASGSYQVTVTFGQSGDFALIGGRSYTGVATGAPAASNATGSGTGSSVNTGTVTPAAASSLVFGGFFDDSSANPESITLTTSGASSVYASTNGTLLPGAAADNIPASTAATSLAWTLGDAPDWGTAVAVYSPATGSAHNATAAATVAPAGTVARQHASAGHATATVTPAGTVVTAHAHVASATATITPAGLGGQFPPWTLLAEDGSPLLAEDGTYLFTEDAGVHAATAAGTITPTGTAVPASGSLTATAHGTVTPTGAATGTVRVPGTAQALATVTPTGTATAARGHSRTAAAVVTPAGLAVRQHAATSQALATVTPGGTAATGRNHAATATATVTPAGTAAAARTHARTATGTITPAGAATGLHGNGHQATAAGTVHPTGLATGTHASHPVAIAGSWTGTFAVGIGFFFPPPAARPLQVPIANTAGDWLFAITAWRPSTTGSDVSVCVADDAHNWWEPVGSPVTDSDENGVVRVSVWAAPAARVANTDTGVTNVQVTPTGPVLSMATLIVDVTGLLPWYQVAAINTAKANAATSLSVSAAAPSARALLFAAFASDDNSKTITGPSGWTALTTASAGNGVDHTTDIKVTPAWQVTTSATSASVSASGTLDLAGVIAGVIVAAPQPAQPNPAWPVMVTEVAIGAGIGTPPSEMTWTPLSGRSLGLSITQGKQYTLGQLQAGQGTLTLDDPDGALIPPGTGAYAGIDSGTPVRRRVTWPGPGGAPVLSPHYVAFSGYIRRWPFSVDENFLRGQVQAELTDAWGYGAGDLNAMAIEECLLDSPHSLWPLTDPPGSTGSGNLVPNGPALNLAVSKYGAGSATVTWGANSGAIIGMSAALITSSGKPGGASGMVQMKLAGNSLSTQGYGYALAATAPDFPPVANGITIEAVAQLAVGFGGISFTAPAGTTIAVSTSLSPGQPVIPTVATGFTFPVGLTAGQTYYVVGQGGTSIQLATTPGGSPVTITTTGFGFMQPTLAWNPVILAARALGSPVAGLEVNRNTGALTLRYRPASATSDTTVTVDATWDYRNSGLWHFSLAFTQTSWRVMVNGGGQANASGTFSSPLAPAVTDVDYMGVIDRTSQGLGWPGYLGGPAGVYPGVSQQVRVISRYWASIAGMSGEPADARVERLLEYGGLTGRRWIGQLATQYEDDITVSGQDVGGQAAVTGVNNVTASTAPALACVAPTGDITYLSKLYTWNQPVRWVLGDDTAAGEIPFMPGKLATDYDPSRVTAQVQLTQLDTQAVTTPSGVMAATTMAAVAQAAGRQYGGQPYQQTGYVAYDWGNPYTAGSSLVDLANWVQAVFARPANRVQAVTVNAAAYPAAWPMWAGAAVGDMVQVNLRLPTASTSPLISLVARITQTARSSQFTTDSPPQATITCTLDFAPECQALTCDDPVRGLLDGATNVMPW